MISGISGLRDEVIDGVYDDHIHPLLDPVPYTLYGDVMEVLTVMVLMLFITTLHAMH